MKIYENYSCLLSYLRNFNEIFRKDVTHDNIKSHKKQGYTLSLEDEFFKISQGCGDQINPPPPSSVVLRLTLSVPGIICRISQEKK